MDRARPVKKHLIVFIFSIESFISDFNSKFRWKAAFFCKMTRGKPIFGRFSSSALFTPIQSFFLMFNDKTLLACFLYIDQIMKLCKIPATLLELFTKAMPLVFHQAPEARGGFLIIYQIRVYLVMVYRKTWLHIVLPLSFRINCIQNLNIILNRKANRKN